MLLRPTDENGDILPVLRYESLLTGAEAVAKLAEYRLELLTGDWWENSGWGCDVLEMMRESRLTEADQETLASYLTTYIRGTPGVQEVTDTAVSAEGREFSFTCTVLTAEGEAGVEFTMIS